MSSLYEQWVQKSQGEQGLSAEKFWKDYMPREQKIYEHLLEHKKNTIKATVADIAKAHDLEDFESVGFLDGISGVLEDELSLEDATAETAVDFTFDFETLFKKMVEYKAKHLYNLPQWDSVLDSDTRKRLTKEQQLSGTIVKEKKVSRNDPCPCGSGKKYKKCCGAND